jgi:hypothetical protein
LFPEVGKNKFTPTQEEKMFKNRSLNTLVGLTIAVLAVFSIGAVAFNRLATSAVNTSPLDWYFSHDHASIDNDNAVVSSVNSPANTSPLDWYFSHDHAIIDGDNNAVPNVSIPVGERYSALKDKQLERMDANVSTVTGSAAPTSFERYMNLKDRQLAQFDATGVANPK